MNRTTCQLSSEIIKLLTKQASHEMRNFVLYSSFANYFSLEGVVDLETYYTKRAEEEKLHHQWILTYMSDADARLVHDQIEINKEEKIESFIDPFISTVEREILTTNMLYAIYEAAIAEKDYMTSSWLFEKLIKEQIEEESISRMARGIMESDGDVFIKAEKVLELLN